MTASVDRKRSNLRAATVAVSRYCRVADAELICQQRQAGASRVRSSARRELRKHQTGRANRDWQRRGLHPRGVGVDRSCRNQEVVTSIDLVVTAARRIHVGRAGQQEWGRPIANRSYSINTVL